MERDVLYPLFKSLAIVLYWSMIINYCHLVTLLTVYDSASKEHLYVYCVFFFWVRFLSIDSANKVITIWRYNQELKFDVFFQVSYFFDNFKIVLYIFATLKFELTHFYIPMFLTSCARA